MKKTFVLDTNVLLHNSNCIEAFADNTVVIPMAVIEELDKFKSNNDELGRNARQVIRRLDRLRKRGRLGEGVPMDNGGMLKIITDKPFAQDSGLDQDIPDNKIIRVAYHLQKSGEKVIFVSKDINARLKSDALGIQTMDFEKQKVNFDELYTGYRLLPVASQKIEEFQQTGTLKIKIDGIMPNEFVALILHSEASERAENEEKAGIAGKSVRIARFSKDGVLTKLSPQSEGAWNIKPRSIEQKMAFELLMDEKVPLVTLVGSAGTGKTLLALAAGLEQTVKQKRYDKMLVSRPIMPLGKDIGYLPGDKETKLMNWMQPIFDNLAYLMRDNVNPRQSVREKIEKLQREHVIELEALTYIRGRSIPKQYVIIDEAQNLTPHEIKTIISRSGEGTKMVLTGDPSQIDNPYLDSNSNGLSYAVERLKPLPLHGHVTLTKSERSSLAAAAADLL
ncbi:MAG: PhoH family protein [Kiritimatiellia bacterium]|nr:PhoH family protein [Kiritimatiellia bacterium]